MSPRPRAVIAVMSSAVFVGFLNMTVASVAFHSIELDFEGTPRSTTAWVLTAYSLVLAALTVPAGRLADHLGHRRLLVWGLAVFTVGSALAGLAPSIGLLIAARSVQAVGGAAFGSTTLAILLRALPPERLGPAVAALTAAAAAGLGIGPPLGGALVSAGGWRAVFVASAPMAALTLIAALRFVPPSPRGQDRRMPDWLGALLLAAGISGIAYALLCTTAPGWRPVQSIVSAGAGAVVLALFVARSRTHPVPILDGAVLRARGAARANLGSLILGAAFNAKLLCDVLFLGAVWGFAPAKIGAAVTPGPVVAAIASRYGGRLINTRGPRYGIVAGTTLYALGCLWYVAGVGGHAAYLTVWVPGIVLTGAGLGLAMPALTFASVVSAPPDRLAVAAAMNTVSRQVAAVVGVAALVALIGSPGGATGVGAYRLGWLLASALAVAAMVATVAPRPRAARATAARPAAAE
jgi:EmrB/QacA subfamily drug resistance transporter